MKMLVMSLVILMSAIGVQAQEAKSESDSCYDNAGSTAAINACASADLDKEDAILNQEYAKLMNGLRKDKSEDGKEIVDRVLQNQRAWIVMRDTTCAVEGIEMLNGSGEGQIRLGCQGRMTRERSAQIVELQKRLLSNQGK